MRSTYCEEHDVWDRCRSLRYLEQQANARVGQPATLMYPDDRYPLRIIRRTRTTIMLVEVRVPGQDEPKYSNGPWPVYDATSYDDDLPLADNPRMYRAHWSKKKLGWYVGGSTPVSVGAANYRRDYSL